MFNKKKKKLLEGKTFFFLSFFLNDILYSLGRTVENLHKNMEKEKVETISYHDMSAYVLCHGYLLRIILFMREVISFSRAKQKMDFMIIIF